MKKIAGVLSLATLSLVSFASAGPVYGVQQLLDGFRQILYIIIQFIFDISGDLGIYDEYIFAKLILLIIIFIVVYTVLDKSIFKDYSTDKSKKPVLYIISAAVSILSIKYLPNEMIKAILLPYSALGVGLTVFLPLVIYFYFLHESGMHYLGRRIGWVIFGASFIALWWSRYDYLESANWIYWAGIGFIAICFIFDQRIHRYFGLSDYRKIQKMSKDNEIKHWKRQLFVLDEDVRNGIVDEQQEKRERAFLDKKLKDAINR